MNDRLILSAPDLLEALIYCVKAYEETQDMQDHRHLWPEPNHIFHARSAIAKATGKPARVSIRLIFRDQRQAEAFAKAWTRATLDGHTIGPEKSGGFYVDIYDVTEERKRWVDAEVTKLRNNPL